MCMFERIKRLLGNKTIQNISKMMTGTMLGQILSVIMVPITTRLYGAEAYGDLAVLTSVASIFISFLGFGLAAAIMVERSDEDASQTYKLAVNATNVLVCVISLLFYIISPWVKIIKMAMPYPITLIILAFYVITTNQVNMLYAWLNRKGRYNILLFNPIITPIVNNGLAIVLAVLGMNGIGLYCGLLVAQAVTLIHMFRHMDRIDYRLRIKDIPGIVKRNRDFIQYQYTASLMNTVVGNLPVQILSMCFGNTVVGYYSMSMKLLNIPSNILSTSMSRVYFKEASDKQRAGGDARRYTLKTCKIVSALYLIPMAGILLLGDIAIPLILGTDWVDSVPYLKIMAIWNLFGIGVSCTSGFSSVISRQKINMIVSAIKLVVFPVAMIAISHIFQNPMFTVGIYALSYSLINILYYEKLIGEEKALRFKYVGMNLFAGAVCCVVFLLSIFLDKIFL